MFMLYVFCCPYRKSNRKWFLKFLCSAVSLLFVFQVSHPLLWFARLLLLSDEFRLKLSMWICFVNFFLGVRVKIKRRDKKNVQTNIIISDSDLYLPVMLRAQYIWWVLVWIYERDPFKLFFFPVNNKHLYFIIMKQTKCD